MLFTANASCSFKHDPQLGRDACLLNSVTFSDLNRGVEKWFLGVEVDNTKWLGTGAYIEFDIQGVADSGSLSPCYPPSSPSSCPAPLPFKCVTNHQIFLPPNGSSITISASSWNFYKTGCKSHGSDIFVKYSLKGTNPVPTPSPVGGGGDALVMQSSQVSDKAQLSANAPLYIVGGFAVLFLALGVFVVQSRDQGVGDRESLFTTKASLFSRPRAETSAAVVAKAISQSLEKKGGRVVQLNLSEVLLDFSLVGSAFISECFFINILFQYASTRHLAGVAFAGRFIHLAVGSLLIYLVNHPSISLPGGLAPLPQQPLRRLCNMKLFKENIKLYGLLCLWGTVDVTLFRYLPWLHSQFSVETKGFPSPFLFILCVFSKLLQAFLLLSCQLVVLAAGARNVPFQAFNLAVNVLSLLVNLVAAVLWTGFLSDWRVANDDGSGGSGSRGEDPESARPGAGAGVEVELESRAAEAEAPAAAGPDGESATANPLHPFRDIIPAPISGLSRSSILGTDHAAPDASPSVHLDTPNRLQA